jgi:hypothetical protein
MVYLAGKHWHSSGCVGSVSSLETTLTQPLNSQELFSRVNRTAPKLQK